MDCGKWFRLKSMSDSFNLCNRGVEAGKDAGFRVKLEKYPTFSHPPHTQSPNSNSKEQFAGARVSASDMTYFQFKFSLDGTATNGRVQVKSATKHQMLFFDDAPFALDSALAVA